MADEAGDGLAYAPKSELHVRITPGDRQGAVYYVSAEDYVFCKGRTKYEYFGNSILIF